MRRGHRLAATADLRVLEITEGDRTASLGLNTTQAAELAARKVGSVSPLPDGQWRVSGIQKVGVIRFDGIELRINPKTPIARLFTLLARGNQWGEWFDEEVLLSAADDLLPSIAEVLGRWGERVLRGGILQGYREERSAEPFIRGRWIVAEQIRRRRGMPLPAELAYDEYTTDIAENRIVRSAARRLLAVGGLPRQTRARLHRIDMRLANVELVTRGVPLPDVQFDRRNGRYRPLVAIAQLVLGHGALEYVGGETTASGHLLNVAKVFEDFVAAEITRHASPFGGEILTQYASYLDHGGHVTIKPDLVWRHGGTTRAVFDAKYKIVHDDRYPNADIYQMLAYCVRHGVTKGHLIYAEGPELPAAISIRTAGADAPPVTVFCHAIDLSVSMPQLEARLAAIAATAFGVS